MSNDEIGIQYTMRKLRNGCYVLIDNDSEVEVSTENEDAVRNLFEEQNDRIATGISLRTAEEVKNLLKAEAIIDGGEDVFREIALGKCYHAILKMIENHQIDGKLGAEVI